MYVTIFFFELEGKAVPLATDSTAMLDSTNHVAKTRYANDPLTL
jgi:hypothetical protein